MVFVLRSPAAIKQAEGATTRAIVSVLAAFGLGVDVTAPDTGGKPPAR